MAAANQSLFSRTRKSAAPKPSCLALSMGYNLSTEPRHQSLDGNQINNEPLGQKSISTYIVRYATAPLYIIGGKTPLTSTVNLKTK